jgi:multidrug efflux pump subunit AcrB
VTVTMTILLSAFVSLTLTPVMAALFMRRETSVHHGRLYLASERVFDLVQAGYRRSLDLAMRHSLITLVVFILTVIASGYLFVVIPKGFFPQQDTGLIIGTSETAQDVSFAEMARRQMALAEIVSRDPDVATIGMTRSAQRIDEPDHQPAAPSAGEGPGCGAVPAACTGYQCRRPSDANAVSVHAAGRRRGGA